VLTQSVSGVAPNEVVTTQVHDVYADHLNAPRVIVRASDASPPDQTPLGRRSDSIRSIDFTLTSRTSPPLSTFSVTVVPAGPAA